MLAHELSVAAMQLGSLGLTWAVAYALLGRLTPMELVPSVLRARARRTCSAVPYVAGLALLLLAWGAAASI